MTSVEIDFIVRDSLAALKLYQSIFDVEVLEATNYEKGSNEVVFTLYGARIHMLDENPQYMMFAPKEGAVQPMWLNVVVEDINATYEKAMKAGCAQIQPLNDMPDMGIVNAMFKDPFGYLWLLHQINCEVSFEDRLRIMEEKMEKARECEN